MKTNLELLQQLTDSPEWEERIAQEVEAIIEVEAQNDNAVTAEDAARWAQVSLLGDLIDAAKGKQYHIRLGLANSLAEKAKRL